MEMSLEDKPGFVHLSWFPKAYLWKILSLQDEVLLQGAAF